jgi:hypothetical protein
LGGRQEQDPAGINIIKYLTEVINMGKGMFHTLKITQELSPLLHGDAQVLNAVGGCQEQVLAGKDNLILNRGHKYGKRNGLPKVKFN